VAVASTALGSMKSIKLSGLVDTMSHLLQAERVRELRLARDFRWLTLAVNVISQIPLLFSGLMVFAAYSIQASVAHKPPLSTAQAFTSFAILALLTTPAGTLLNSFPIVRSGLGLVRRIQDFLLKDSFDDGRAVAHEKEFVEVFDKSMKYESRYHSHNTVLSVTNLVTGPPNSGSAESKSEDRAISFNSRRSSLTIINGPVGCGKSTLLKALLGEVKPLAGTISISTPFVGYCSQTPWLPNCKIRDAIIGPSKFDHEWYREVVNVCALETDFTRMPDNDMTSMGTRGVMLSGGQKHRIVSK
jgi:ATP-binding cassette, subfamily C (CFTR/MRP), member 1